MAARGMNIPTRLANVVIGNIKISAYISFLIRSFDTYFSTKNRWKNERTNVMATKTQAIVRHDTCITDMLANQSVADGMGGSTNELLCGIIVFTISIIII